MYSETVRTTLEKAGWRPERRVTIEPWVEELGSEGFSVSPEAVSLLENFGGLVVVPPQNPSNVYRPEVLTFDPVIAASGEFDRVDYWQKYLDLNLSPLGETGGGALLLLADDGRVFTCWDDVLWLDGESFEDAFENTLIVARRRPQDFARMSEA